MFPNNNAYTKKHIFIIKYKIIEGMKEKFKKIYNMFNAD